MYLGLRPALGAPITVLAGGADTTASVPPVLLPQNSTDQPAASRRLWAFPGQGSQRVGMGQALYESSAVYRENFDRAHQALQEAEGVDLRGLVFSDAEDSKAAQEELTRTLHAQPALLTSSISYLEHLKNEVGIGPADQDLMAGHSLGEWTAYVASGALTLEEGVVAVYWRGRFMEEAFPFDPKNPPMIAILGLETSVIEALCTESSREGHVVVPANYNDPGQLVISGHPAAVKEAADKMAQEGARVVPLKAAGPFHTPLMDEVKEKLSAKLAELGIKIGTPTQTIISNFTAKPIAADGDHLQSLMDQITGAVRWHDSMLEASRLGARQFVSIDVAEDAKGDVLLKMARNIFSREAPVHPVDLRIPMQRNILFFPPDAFQTTVFPAATETATQRLLRYSYNAPAVAKAVRKLVESGDEADLRLALEVVKNDYNKARDAGLRELQTSADHPLVNAAMQEYSRDWPAAEIRDLEQWELPAETIEKITEEILPQLEERSVAPLDSRDLIYYVATRWGGDEEKLTKVIYELNRTAGMNALQLKVARYGPPGTPKKLKKQGINSWETLVLYLDFSNGIQFEHPGAMSKGDIT